MKRNKNRFILFAIILILIIIVYKELTIENPIIEPTQTIRRAKPTTREENKHVAIFIEIDDTLTWSYSRRCIQNIADARTISADSPVSLYQSKIKKTKIFALDLHIAISQSLDSNDLAKIKREINELLVEVDNIYTEKSPDLEFLSFKRITGLESYLVLHIAGKSKTRHRHSIECLCGTSSQVLAILNQFKLNDNIKMINPHGFTLSQKMPSSQINPLLETNILKTSFESNKIKKVYKIYEQLFDEKLQEAAVRSVAEKTFWARNMVFNFVAKIRKEDLIDDAFRSLVPSISQQQGYQIVEMIPAPKILPLYFPQFHAIPENDKFWGKNFTEWTLLRSALGNDIFRPLSESEGGLGYYNLLDKMTRIKQSMIARSSGVYGFVYYHYWFSGKNAPDNHKVMYKIPELVLEEEEPNLPFMLSWANEPWSKRWTGEMHDVLLGQDYGNKTEWEDHFNYLLKFFQHDMYIKVEGKPVFVIYRIGHIDSKLEPILALWNTLAISNGFPLLYIISTIGCFF